VGELEGVLGGCSDHKDTVMLITTSMSRNNAMEETGVVYIWTLLVLACIHNTFYIPVGEQGGSDHKDTVMLITTSVSRNNAMEETGVYMDTFGPSLHTQYFLHTSGMMYVDAL